MPVNSPPGKRAPYNLAPPDKLALCWFKLAPAVGTNSPPDKLATDKPFPLANSPPVISLTHHTLLRLIWYKRVNQTLL